MSIWPISIKYAGKPQGKGRARVKTFKGKTWGYTPPKTAAYEEDLKWLAKAAMIGRKLLTGPTCMMVSVSFKSKNVGKHIIKPDLSNVIKAVEDSLNGIVYDDDCRICQLTASKFNGSEDYIIVSVWPFEETSVAT